MPFDPATCIRLLKDCNPVHSFGKVTKVVGLVVEATGLKASLGDVCHIIPDNKKDVPIAAEVVGFKDNSLLFMPYGEMRGVRPGSLIQNSSLPPLFPASSELLGRTLDAFGNPLDKKPPINPETMISLYADPPAPLDRPRIDETLDVGVRCINSLLTMGKGQRVGIMAGSGVGKSTLMGMMARYTEAEVIVMGLIGERGREVLEFMERDLGAEGMARSCVIVATSDQPALVRMRAAYAATAVAEYFRDQGKDVLLMMDNLTRFSMAQREIGLASGEPPVSRGYPPSVYSEMPRLLERAGCAAVGSITGLYTVLVDGDDMNEPITDTARSILDGHIMLNRKLAHQNHYPAIDVLQSISRCMSQIVDKEHKSLAGRLKNVLATYNEAEDLINIGAYKSGSNPNIDYAIEKIDAVNGFLMQMVEDKFTFEESVKMMEELFEE